MMLSGNKAHDFPCPSFLRLSADCCPRHGIRSVTRQESEVQMSNIQMGHVNQINQAFPEIPPCHVCLGIIARTASHVVGEKGIMDGHSVT